MRVLLSGFMGAGKTTVGGLLAARLGVPFRDLDRMVEERSGLSVRELFESAGEEEFRRLERSALAEACSLDPVVIRHEVEERFSPEHMVADYIAAYEATIEAAR